MCRRPGRRGRRAGGTQDPARPRRAQRRAAQRAHRAGGHGLRRGAVRRAGPGHAVRRRPTPGHRAGADHVEPVRARRAHRPDPGVPAVRRRRTAGPRHRGRGLARRARPRAHRAGRRRAARRPAQRDVRRVLAARRPQSRRHGPGAARGEREAPSGQPLQQGHQGPDRARPAGGRREPADAGARWPRCCATSAGPSRRRRSGTSCSSTWWSPSSDGFVCGLAWDRLRVATDESSELAGVKLSHLEQPVFDGAGATKGDLVAYLDAVHERLLPELRDRALSVVRARLGQAPFMQKNLPKYAPDWIRTTTVWANASKREVRYPVCDDRRTLVWLANQRAVEYHPALVRVDSHTQTAPDPRPRPARRRRAGPGVPDGGRGRPPGPGGAGRRRSVGWGEDQRRQGRARVRPARRRPRDA